MSPLVAAARRISEAASALSFSPPVAPVYNPLDYAWDAHREYLERYGSGTREVVFLGMNPGPWGMAQTGVPFGDVPSVRDWLGITAGVQAPGAGHPRRPIPSQETRNCPRHA